MSTAESIAARLIGTLFVERGLVSEDQVAVALEVQQETGQRLGDILVERFGVSRPEIERVVAAQWQDMGRRAGPALEGALSESWRRLGDILVTRGFVTEEELDRALSRQRQTGERLGEALLALGAISKFELAGALAEQMESLAEASDASSTESGTVVALHTRQLPADEPPATDGGAPLAVVEERRATESSESPAGEQLEPDGDTPTPPALHTVPTRCLGFASTSAGYVLVPLEGSAPGIGETVNLDGLGELVVLRHSVSPLPLDSRLCVILEQPGGPSTLTFSFAS